MQPSLSVAPKLQVCVRSGEKCQKFRTTNTPRGVVNSWIWGKNLLFGKIFAENCMKMRKSGPGGGVLEPPLDSPM